jgi:hypothetical protein
MASWISRGLPSAGIYAGPTAWLIDTQANYALVPWVCATQVKIIPFVAAAMLALSLFGGFLSWRGYATAGAAPDGASAVGGRPHRFVALMGIACAILFGIVIVVHGAAGMIFHGCER